MPTRKRPTAPTYCEECIAAIEKLKSLDFEVIRKERFKLTPEGVFQELVRNMQYVTRREAEEEKRRLAMLDGDVGTANTEDVPDTRPSNGDKFNCNPDGFHNKTGVKPHNWETATRIAEVVHIDEMRALFACVVSRIGAVNLRARW